MKLQENNHWLPPHTSNAAGAERRVGVEIEYAGVDAERVLDLLQKHFGGTPHAVNRAEYELHNTRFGDFELELDANAVKQLADLQGKGAATDVDQSIVDELAESVGDMAMDWFTQAAEQLVPWEIVSPPIPLSGLHELRPMISDLRDAGALGTRHALRYAFGVHLNPELPSLDASTIVNYLRAYFVLYDWIAAQERIDTARKITPYIDHFDKPYVKLLIDPGYAPCIEALIDDYIAHNPTRNRSLDMLPLFAHLDEQRVRDSIDDDRIKARPTFHYRLPNCDIDSPDWNIDLPWSLWLEVEKLAFDAERLGEYCQLYAEALERLTHSLDGQWPAQVGALLDEI